MKSKLMLLTMILLIAVFVSQSAFAANCEFTFTANEKTYYAIHNTTEGYYECLNPEQDMSPRFNDPSAEYLAYDNAFYAARAQHTCATELDASDYFTPQYIGGEDIHSVRRGDTFVVSMNLSVLKNENYEDPFFKAEPEVHKGKEAVEYARDLLPESEFKKFCDDYERTGEAKGTAYVLSFVGEQGGSFKESDLFMDTRLIGSKWVTITRPFETVGNTWDTRTNINRMSLHAKNGKLEVETNGNGGFYLYLEPERMKDAKTEIQVKKGDLSIEVFDLEKQLNAPAYVAVIRDKNGADKSMWNVSFQIGDIQRNSLNGYVDGKDAVYCCILDEYESQLLREEALIQLIQQ